MVRIEVDIPDELVCGIEDTMNTYELTVDEFVLTAITRLMDKRPNAHAPSLHMNQPLEIPQIIRKNRS